MKKFISRFTRIAALACVISGFVVSSSHAQEVAVLPFPPEYRVVAKHLGQDMQTSPELFRNTKSPDELLDLMRSQIADLRAVRSSDSQINHAADAGQSAYAEELRYIEQVIQLPKPMSMEASAILANIRFFLGDVGGAVSTTMGDYDKQSARFAAANAFADACDRADGLDRRLIAIAQKYAAPMTPAANLFTVDIAAAWGPFGTHDWFMIYNAGPALDDCTIVVELTGKNGDTRKNVHFVEQLPSNKWMYAQYDLGQEWATGRPGLAFRKTVTDIQKATVSVWSPKLSTEMTYVYQGAEKDKDIAALCKTIKFTGSYQPFEGGVFWNTNRGAKFSLEGIAFLPKCQATVTFRKGSDMKQWRWDFDSWKQDEVKTFDGAGQLTFDPDYVDLSIAFPGTSYTQRTRLTVR